MGNQNCFCLPDRPSALSTYLEVNNGTSVHMPAAADADPNTTKTFFTKYVQDNQQKTDPDQIQTVMDQRRIVFISLTGLYTTWKNVPPVLLQSALLLLPLKRKWIMKPSKYSKPLEARLIFQVMKYTETNMQEILTFIKLLQWKESQGLALWLFDYFDDVGNLIDNQKGSVADPLIASFWYGFNDKLMHLYDPITETNYKSLHLEKKWWMNKDKYRSKYGVKAVVVLKELYYLSTKHSHDAVKEIFYQSNPRSLHPITVYKKVSNNCTAPVIVRAKDRLKAQHAVSPLSPIKERLGGRSVEVDSNITDLKYHNVYLQCVQKSSNALVDKDDR
eukprot:86590_1